MTQVANNEGIGEVVLWLTEGSSDQLRFISCVKTACVAATDSGYADYVQCDESGLSIVSASAISASQDQFANDTWCVVHPFTAGTTAAVLGFMVANSTSNALYGIHCFAAAVNMLASDTLTCTMKGRLKNG